MVRPSTPVTSAVAVTLQADRRRREMADVEMDAEALMPGGQQVLDRRQRGRLDHVDHHRRRQHRDAPRADARRGVLGATTRSAVPVSPAWMAVRSSAGMELHSPPTVPAQCDAIA